MTRAEVLSIAGPAGALEARLELPDSDTPPAAFGVAVTFGPHVWNFRDAARRLCEVGGAVQVYDGRELEEATLRLLGAPGERKAVAAAARAMVLTQQGATSRTLDRLDALLNAEAGRASVPA